ncbi:hypothetical protein EJB05_25817, partial [Eragrostis curvula]
CKVVQVLRATMAELVIGPLVSMVKEKASSYLLDQYKVMEGMEEQRTTLERKLPAILDIIQDAEEKGAFRPGVRAWLKDLKKVSYQANDVFDEFKYEALRREAEKKGHYSLKTLRRFPARNPIVFRYRMGKKLQKIVQTIEVLVTEMNTFGFRHLQQAPTSKQWRKTDPIMVDSDKDIISRSREEEKKKILKILVDEASSKDLTVFPIVGMGGLGKTTFVQLVYNDPAIEDHFELRRWCCVSDDFDAATIASALRQTNRSDKGREKELQDLQSMISGKKYLIVLDDVWDLDHDNWGKLKTCLKYGDKGSVVLTTTRNAKIAQRMTMGVTEAYNIEELGYQYLKEIVQSRAFRFQRQNNHDVDGIVDKIVDRCAGSPLAAKAFGSMLSAKTNLNDWKDTLAKSTICNERTEIGPILKLSFDDLSPDMKQCFAFCAMFPKDYEIDVELLIQLWMAHDLIPVQEDDHPETKGEEIFKELTWRSFFQEVKQTSHGYHERLQFRKKTTCKIHDLMHDIALSVMGKECVTIVDIPSMKKLLPNPTLHFFSSYKGNLLNDCLKKQGPTVRTLFCEDNAVPYRHISKYASLRAVHLPVWNARQVYLQGQIQHLRYLNLSRNRDLKQLPEEISIMYNLQTLDISHCYKLRQLPKDMKYMASLRHFYTNGCTALTCMPPELGQITSLQTLTYFVVGASSGCSTIRELEKLNLGGELELSCLENATEVHAKGASLENKKKLTHLSLGWNNEGQEEPEQDCHKNVLYALKPNAGLELLRIVGYKGTSLPTWITDLSNLTELHLLGCVQCEEFPPFSHFKALQVLYLKKLDKLLSLCSGAESVTFPALKELRLHDLESLERWVALEEKKELTFPVLEKLDIKNCPKLTSLPEAPNLKDIVVHEDKALLSLAVLKSKHVYSLSKLDLSTGDTEDTPPQIDENHESSVSEIRLSGDFYFFFSSNPAQHTFGAWKWFGKLITLSISYCYALIYWPEDVFQSLVSLRNLRISDCQQLEGRMQVKGGEPIETADQVLPHLSMISIVDCSSLTELFILPPSLRSVYIHECPRLESVWGNQEHPETNTDIQLEYSRDFTSTYDMVEPMQYLYVTVMKARDLPTMDVTGALDPYVEVRLGNFKGVTKHLEKNPNPGWRQTFAFSREHLQSNLLEIVVKDKDDFVGRIAFDTSDIPSRVPPDSPLAPQWYCLAGRGGEKLRHGEIMLAVWFGTPTQHPEQSPSPRNRLPCLEVLDVFDCDNLATLPALPPSLKRLSIDRCGMLCSVSGHLDALESLYIFNCSKLRSLDSLGDLPSLERMNLRSCRCLASLPGVLGSYSALRELTVKYCPAIDLKPLYKRHQQRLDSLAEKDISHAHSCDPSEGPKLRELRSWKYAIPGVQDWTKRHHRMY